MRHCLPGASLVPPWCLFCVSLVLHWCLPAPRDLVTGLFLDAKNHRRFSLKLTRGPQDATKVPPERQMLFFKLPSSPFFEPRPLQNARSCFLHCGCKVHFRIFGNFYFPFSFICMAVYSFSMFGLRLALRKMFLKPSVFSTFLLFSPSRS